MSRRPRAPSTYPCEQAPRASRQPNTAGNDVNDDEYLQVGFISRLASGNVARTVGLVAAAAMIIPIAFFLFALVAR